MSKFFCCILAGIAVSVAAVLPVQAQSVKYGALEALFGEPVTTSATGKPQRSTDVPITMEIISAADIRRSGAHDIPEVLRRLAGVEVWRWSLASVDVAVRGYNQPYSPRLLVLINGRQVYLDHDAFTLWHALPVELAEIRQIEVVKGPNTALFGFNAAAGVVNIITYNPLYDDINNVTARVGTRGYRELSAVKTVRLDDRAAIRLSVGGDDSEDFGEVGPRARETGLSSLAPRRRSFSADSLFQVTDRVQVGLEATRSLARGETFYKNYFYAQQQVETQSAKAIIVADTPAGLFEATLYRNWMTREYPDHSDWHPMKENVTVARVQNLFKLGPHHSVRLFGEFRRNAVNTNPAPGGRIGYDIFAAGGMWDWRIADTVTWTNAVRVDHLRLDRRGTWELGDSGAAAPFSNEDFDRRLTEYSFNSGLVIKPTDLDTVRLSVARGVQLPSLINLGGNLIAGPLPGGLAYVVSGSPYLQPAVVTNFEVSYDRELPKLDSALRLSLFHQINQNFTSQAQQVPTRVRGNTLDFLAENIGDSRTSGLEVGLKGKIGPSWQWDLNYTYQAIQDRLTTNQGGIHTMAFDGKAGTPHHQIKGHLGYSAGRFEADLFAAYATRYALPRTDLTLSYYPMVTIAPHLVVDARLGYKLTDHLTVAVEGASINQPRYRETTGAAVERRVFFSVRADF